MAGNQMSMGRVWSDTPGALKGGVIVAVVAWFVSVSSATVRMVNGAVESCSYFDILKVGGAAIIVALVGAGFVANSKSRRPLPTPVLAVISLVLIAVAVLLAIRGFGVAMSPCQAADPLA